MQVLSSDAIIGLHDDPVVRAAVSEVSTDRLRSLVETLAYPRHYEAEPDSNRKAGAWLAQSLGDLGLGVHRQGRYANVIADAQSVSLRATPVVLGAHFDSVPGTPGADDNASAVATLLECARVLTTHLPILPIRYIGFNREEDALLGSKDYVANAGGPPPAAVHVLEMLGYASDATGSQRTPAELPIEIPDRGNFISIIGDARAAASVERGLAAARTYSTRRAIGLVVPSGLKRVLRVLHRSDHAPFWFQGIGAVFWTDTAEFRNPHYHLATDTPDTLDYTFLTDVTRMLVATLIAEGRALKAPAAP